MYIMRCIVYSFCFKQLEYIINILALAVVLSMFQIQACAARGSGDNHKLQLEYNLDNYVTNKYAICMIGDFENTAILAIVTRSCILCSSLVMPDYSSFGYLGIRFLDFHVKLIVC